MFPARPRPNVALSVKMFLRAKSGADDQDQSNETAVKPSRAALTTTRILNNLTDSRKSLTESPLRMPIAYHLESASVFRL